MSEPIIDRELLALKAFMNHLHEKTKLIPEDQHEAHYVIQQLLAVISNYQMVNNKLNIKIRALIGQIEAMKSQALIKRIK